jgi:hypothetical protein
VANISRTIGADAFYSSALARPWLNPISLQELRAAVKAKEPQVELDGRKFSIKYEDNDKIWVQIVGDYIPCGRFTIREITIPDLMFEGA